MFISEMDLYFYFLIFSIHGFRIKFTSLLK